MNDVEKQLRECARDLEESIHDYLWLRTMLKDTEGFLRFTKMIKEFMVQETALLKAKDRQ